MIVLPDSQLEFDEEQHLYTLRGMKLPSVTQIMEPMSLMLYNGIPQETLFGAADRGTRAHEPYLEAFHAFEGAYKPVWIGSEYRTYHKALRYAGTIDLIGYIEPDDGTGVDVVDIKCTAVYHPVMLATQVSAYCEALKSQGIPVRRRYGLQLQKSGKPRFEQVEDGYKTFLHCLAIHNAMAVERKP